MGSSPSAQGQMSACSFVAMLHCIRLHHGMHDHYIMTTSSWVSNTNLLSTSQEPRCADLIMTFATRLFVSGTMLRLYFNPYLQHDMLKTSCSVRWASIPMPHCLCLLCCHVKEFRILVLFLCHTSIWELPCHPLHSACHQSRFELFALTST